MTDQLIKPALNTTRRQFAAMGVAAVAATGMGSTASASALPVVERTLAGSTLFAPELGEHPGLVMYASPAASQSANATVARDLAKQGWAVMLVAAPTGDAQTINRAAKVHTATLAGQRGVAKAVAGYSLRSFGEAAPLLGIGKVPAAKRSAALFALPLSATKDAVRQQSLHQAARSLSRMAA